MLSRVANSLYWMVRYIERADNMARVIEGNERLILDLARSDLAHSDVLWKPIIQSIGDEAVFTASYPDGSGRDAVHFLTSDRGNPNSILSCISLARENARMVRDQLAEALWEELNGLFLFLNSNDGARLLAGDPAGYYEMIRHSTHAFHGIAAATSVRGEAWEFMDLGRHLERADKTTRFLDIATYLDERTEDDALHGDDHWMAVLRSCGGLGAFRVKYRGKFKPRNIVEFLILAADFPRSVRYCVDRVDASLHAISGSTRGGFCNDAERQSGYLLSILAFGSCEDIMAGGLHTYLDDTQRKLNGIAEAIFRSYVLLPDQVDERPSIPSSSLSAVVRWQIEQQQQ